MRRPREARLVSRVLRLGLVVAFAVQVASSFAGQPARALTEQERLGRQLYEAGCSSCHGLDVTGTQYGPSLEGVGAASLDFQLSTGRMPLGDPDRQPRRGEPRYTPEQIAAIVAYVQAVAPGGPPIPVVDIEGADLPRGMEVYLANCAGCHGAGASGTSVGGGQIAPGLDASTPTQVGEAIRVGPGLMPRWGEDAMTPEEVDAVAAYLDRLPELADQGGLPFNRVGAVVEGLIAGVLGLAVIIVIVRLTGAKL